MKLNCAESFNCVVSAIYVTSMAFFERLYLVLGPRQFALFVTTPYASTPPPIRLELFLDFYVFSPNFVPGLGPNFGSERR